VAQLPPAIRTQRNATRKQRPRAGAAQVDAHDPDAPAAVQGDSVER
jgi:hypothetical protein